MTENFVPNSYIISVTAPELSMDSFPSRDAWLEADRSAMAQTLARVEASINGLIKSEGAQAEIKNKMEILGVLVLECDADFAAKVKGLPEVQHVAPERVMHLAAQNPTTAAKKPAKGLKL